MKKIILITGGGRSGKSRYALGLAEAYPKKAFIATAEPIDKEMEERIIKHRQERGEAFLTIEEPLDLSKAIYSLPRDIEVAVIDCLTVWLGNLMHRTEKTDRLFPEVTSFLKALKASSCDLIIITNEVGMGVIPSNKLARQYRDISGQLNQSVACLADQVILMVSGFPLIIKGERT